MFFFNRNTIQHPGENIPYEEQVRKLKEKMQNVEAIVLGAGSGLSTAAGFTYSGERFQKYFFDFANKYPIQDIYSGGFFPFESPEEFWAWWSRHIYFNRYVDAPSDVYGNLKKIVEGKDHFVLTTNVDHQFQRAGFEKERLFYTQGDYGLFQSSRPTVAKTYDNQEIVETMLEAQGFVRDNAGIFQLPEDKKLKMLIPTELIPICPDDGLPMTMNLRTDESFVEDAGWKMAAKRYQDFLHSHKGKHVLYWELGVGMNTPVIIKFVFHRLTAENPHSTYVCINKGEAYAPQEIANRSIVINDDIGEVIRKILY